MICGEAEYIWPQFCNEFTAGLTAPLYRETGTVALTDSPTPRFDLLKLEQYTTVTLQFSRGCPFRCEFCDIIVMFGRKPRWKGADQVTRELDALRLRKVRNVFFVDDNLIGNKKAAKELLQLLCDYQARHDYRFTFGTEASLNLAGDALIADADSSDNTRLGTNFLPRRMTYDEMIAGYRTLYDRLSSDRGIADRVRNKMRYLANPVYHGEYTVRERIGIVGKLLTKGVLPGGLPRLGHFLRSVPWRSPAKVPLAVVDWIAGLAMRDFVERHFRARLDTERTTLAARTKRLRSALRAYLDQGSAAISLDTVAAPLPCLTVSLAGALDPAFFARLARHGAGLMRRTSSRLTLRVDALGGADLLPLQRMLRRLAPYGDRISIVLHEHARNIVPVDSSVFHLVLTRRTGAAAGAT